MDANKRQFERGQQVRCKGDAAVGKISILGESAATVEYRHAGGAITFGEYPLENLEIVTEAAGIFTEGNEANKGKNECPNPPKAPSGVTSAPGGASLSKERK